MLLSGMNDVAMTTERDQGETELMGPTVHNHLCDDVGINMESRENSVSQQFHTVRYRSVETRCSEWDQLLHWRRLSTANDDDLP